MSQEEHPEDVRVSSVSGSTDADPLADPSLLAGVRQRDREALGRFFDAAFPQVYSLAYRLTGNRTTAEDIAQDVFLKVYGAADRLDASRNARPWLTTITYNACRDVLRQRSRRSADLALEVVEGRLAGTGTPEEDLSRREAARMLQRALMQLDEPLRAVVVLHDYSGMSHEAIASMLGATHAAVRKRYSRALRKLREHLEEHE